jgi:branched-chain amino acid transport system permease protein
MITLIGINVILAVSLNLINGLAGQFSIGHAGFMAVGGYTATYVTVYHGADIAGLFGSRLGSAVGDSIVMIPSLLAGAAAASLAGLAVGIPSLRLKGDYLAIVTLGFGEIIRVLILNIPAVGGATGFTAAVPITNFFWIFAMAVLTIVIVRNIATSTFGYALASIRTDEIAAEAMGINTTRYKITAFLVGAFFAGIAGGVYAHFKQYIAPQGFGFDRSIEIVVMVILGGMGNTTGVIAAAILLTVLGETLRQFGDYRMILYSLVIIVLMITRPQGLFTWSLRRRAS